MTIFCKAHRAELAKSICEAQGGIWQEGEGNNQPYHRAADAALAFVDKYGDQFGSFYMKKMLRETQDAD
jgi:hypothetical protein